MSWNGRKVLVTGADGFIGSHLTEALLRAGAHVRALCMYNSFNSRGWLDTSELGAHDALDAPLGDIRDARFVDRACEDVEVVFHLAALTAIPYSYVAPESFVDTNVRGTLNMLEAVRRAGCARLVHTSTSEVYGTPETLPITERHALQGQSPYSATKIAADMLAESYARSFETPVVILRPFNTFGPRQSARAVIPTILAQLLTGKTTIQLGNVKPRRDLTYVSDTVAGFLAAGSVVGIEGDTIHLGTGRSDSIEDVFQAACRACGVTAKLKTSAERFRPDRSEVQVLQSDPSRARAVLGWSAKVSLEDGLTQTAEWLRGNIHRYSPDRYVI